MHAGEPHWFDFLGLGVTSLFSAALIYLTWRQWNQGRPHVWIRGYGPREGGLEVAYLENRGGAGTTVVAVGVTYYRQRPEPRSIRLFRIYRWPIWRKFSRVISSETRPFTTPGTPGLVATQVFVPAHSTQKILFAPLESPQSEPAIWIALKPQSVHGIAHTAWNRRRHAGVTLTVTN